jgi:hypothetical protein
MEQNKSVGEESQEEDRTERATATRTDWTSSI